jgi:putative MATE family efflux protein
VLTQIAMLIIDGLMCGHIPDRGLSLTALGFGVQIWFLLIVPASALGVGTVALVSRAHGAQDSDRVNVVIAQSAQIALVIGIVLGITSALAGESLCSFLGASPPVAAKGAAYLQMLTLGFPAIFLAEGCISAALRAVGTPRIPFLCGLAGNAINVVLVYGLAFGHLGMPELGLAGAGLATAISMTANVVLQAIAIRAGVSPGMKLRVRVAAIDREMIGQIVRVGVPAFFEQVSFYGSMTTLVWVLARVDETSVAANAVGSRVAAFLMTPVFALSMATATLSGKALGASSPDDARRVLRIAVIAAVIIMLPIAVATWFGSHLITAAYDIAPGSQFETFAIQYLHIIAFAIVLQGVMLAFEGLLEGAGASRTVMKINLTANLGLRVTLALILGLCTSYGAFGVWLSWPAALLVQLPLAFIAYRRGAWAKTGLTV